MFASDSSPDYWSIPVKILNGFIKFKIDSGADNTVIPLTVYNSKFKKKKISEPDKIFCGPDGKKLNVIGKFITDLKHGLKTCNEEIYVIDGLKTCLLGKPAIKAFDLIPNLQSNVSEVSERTLINEFPKLFTGLGLVADQYKIKLTSEAVPVAISVPRRIPIPLLKQTEIEIKRMVEEKVIVPVTEATDWCSPVVIVPKSDGNVRICVDLTELNRNVKREFHPLPKVEYTLSLLTGAKVFSKLDANSGFWQIPLDEESSYLTTFITPFGRYRFLRLPFGISSAPEIFQRKMSQILENIQGTVCHMDDILIWGRDQKEHDIRLREVLQLLLESGLTLNRSKCQVSVQRIKFLGHILDKDGIHPDDEKVRAIANLSPPVNKTELKRFLGMVNYLARFIPNFSDIVHPLTGLLSKRNEFIWDVDQMKSFENLKSALSSHPVLKVFNPNLTSTLSADASSYGLGATLRQEEKGKVNIIAYASRTLTETERRYAQIEKEALALAWACEKFHDYLSGTHFKIESDHKPLIPILTKKNLDDLSPRLQRLRLRMMRYSFEIFHIPGKEMYIADTLSRQPRDLKQTADELEEEINAYIRMIVSTLPASCQRLESLRKAQQQDATCLKLREYAENGWPSKRELEQCCLSYWPNRYEISMQDGLLMRGCRIIVPLAKRKEVLNQIHEGHMGITKCRARARSAVYWPKINSEIEESVKKCLKCIKESTNKAEPLKPTEFPERPWEVVGMDLFKFNGSWYLIVMDYFSRYPEIAKLESLSSKEVIEHCKSIFARHGIPDIVRSDNGPQFDSTRSSEFSQFAKSYGFRHITSSPNFPQSNGFIESAVKTVKMRLKKATDPYLALMAYRSSPLENGLSPSELLMNRRIKTTLPIAKRQLNPCLPNRNEIGKKEEKRIERQMRNYNQYHGVKSARDLNPGEEVWITDKRKTGEVIKTSEQPRSYIIKSGTKFIRRNRKMLIPAPNILPDEDEVALPDNQEPSVIPVSPADPTTSNQPTPTYITRSGRTVRPPDRLDL